MEWCGRLGPIVIVSAGRGGLLYAPLNGSLLDQRPWKFTRRVVWWAISHAMFASSRRYNYRLDAPAVRTSTVSSLQNNLPGCLP